MSSGSDPKRPPAPTLSSTTDPLAATVRPRAEAVTPGSYSTPNEATLDSNTLAPAPEVRTGMILGGRYELLAELGRGGGGVVFRARDLRAEAIVALKLLEHDPSSSGKLSRFRRELSLARKVTHPNVVRIYDLVDLPGRVGLSMELVEGGTLAARLEQGALPAADVERLAVDLAEALAAAHEAGVTHRDLKPSNILFRAGSGSAVVTDFGVSRLHEADLTASEEAPAARATSEPAAYDAKLTNEGALVGTPIYMAPEQLEKASVGPPADIYAYGLVLFEAATGRRPYDAQTLAALREARATPLDAELAPLRATLSPRLWEVLSRSLRPHPGHRFRNGAELRNALLRAASIPPPRTSKLPGFAFVAGGIALLAGAGYTLEHARHAAPAAGSLTPKPPQGTRPYPFHPIHHRRVTFGDGCEAFPSFTPDGKKLVFEETNGSRDQLFELDVASGAQRQITHDDGNDLAPALSPDGRRIAYTHYSAEKQETRVIDLDGASPPKRVGLAGTRASWSRDGQGIWLGQTPVNLIDVADPHVIRGVDTPEDSWPWMMRELSNGSLIIGSIDVRPTTKHGIGLVPPGGTFHWVYQATIQEVLAVTPDEKHVFVSLAHDTGVPELYDVPLDGSPPTSLFATEVQPTMGLDFAPDARSIAWSTCDGKTLLARLDANGRTTSLLPKASWSDVAVALLPGSNHLLVVSTRSGTNQLWEIDPTEQVQPRLIATPGLKPTTLAVSPDGTQVTFVVEDEGLYLVPLAGAGDAPARRLTSEPTDANPAFSRDGRAILVSRKVGGGSRQVWTVPLDGAPAHALLQEKTTAAVESPKEPKLIYFELTAKGRLPRVRDERTGKDTPLSKALPEATYSRLAFSPDGKRVAVQLGTNAIADVDLATGAIVRRIEAPAEQFQSLAYTEGGFYVVRDQFVGDLWMADLTTE
ncbi:MAG TPA: protein kinase [Polyangiaceae bacterium]|jgi:serine/threonine protein kinase/Tol biopolymer transport system component